MAKEHTRESIRDTLKASRDWNYTNSDSKLWAIAFGLYNEAHTDQQLELKWNCAKCYQRVKDWLEKA
jgi:hypothetical protein